MRFASRDQVVALVREFYDRHGRLPFKQEWEHADGERPTRRTIERRWGWEELLADAVDIEPDEVEDAFKSEDRYVAMKRALRLARQGLGRWPGANEWERSGRRPSRRTYIRWFGSWEQAIWAAARDTIRTLFLDPPPAVRSVFDQLVDEE
jgi:hypothetical protein